MTFRVPDPAPRVQHDEARYVSSASPTRADRWDVECERSIELVEGARLRRYLDFVRSPRSRLARTRAGRRTNRRVELVPNGTVRYSVKKALCRTLEEGTR